jgi:biotin carboxylase
MSTRPALFLHSFSPTDLSDTLLASALQGLSQRALLLVGTNDVVCCDTAPDADYLSYLADFGLAPQHIIIPKEKVASSLAERLLLDTALLQTLANENRCIEPYMAAITEWLVADKLGYAINGTKPDYLAYLNQKTSLNTLLAESNLPYLPSITCQSHNLETTALQAYKRYGTLVIRASLGLGSKNVWLAADEKAIKHIHRTIVNAAYPHHRRYVITPFIANTLSLNAQFLLRPTDITFLGISQQHIDAHLHYTGNSKPASPIPLQQQIVTQINQLADYLQQQGYLGYLGIDIIVSGKEVFIIEINPRVNTSTFTLVGVKRIMGSLDNTCFASASLSIPQHLTTFRHFEACLQPLLLRPNSKQGILPIMSPTANKSIDIIAIAPNRAEIRVLLKHAKQMMLI